MTHRGGEDHLMEEAEIGGLSHKSRNSNSHNKLEEVRNKFSPNTSGGSIVLLTPWFQPNDNNFRLVASRTERKQITVVLNNPIYGNFLQQPQET